MKIPNAEVVEKSEVQGAGKDEFRGEMRKTIKHAMKVTEQEPQEWMSESRKTLPRQPESVFLFLSCQRRAVGVIRRSAADPGQDTDKHGRFLLPVKGRLQGKRQGC